jgi:hypothetical protein
LTASEGLTASTAVGNGTTQSDEWEAFLTQEQVIPDVQRTLAFTEQRLLTHILSVCTERSHRIQKYGE